MDCTYFSAQQLLQALSNRDVSSRELVESMIGRIEQLNPSINAVVASNFAAARARANAADLSRQRGEESLGLLHGLPITIKDTFSVAGMPCTAGSMKFKDYIPQRNASVVDRLVAEGAIILGKTNVPLLGLDIQTFNKVYGTTENPWRRGLTPGGSSGGAAAAVAAGITPLEIGSDIGGSIRIPAHFCGIYGHKSTLGVINMRGHIPGPPNSISESDMMVAGPLARSAGDLRLLLDVIARPGLNGGPGWKLALPECTKTKLAEFNVLLWLSDPGCELSEPMREVLERLYPLLRRAGANVEVAAPLEYSLDDFYPLYLNLLGSALSDEHSLWSRNSTHWLAPALEKAARFLNLPKHLDHYLQGVSQSHVEWLRMNEKRCVLQQRFARVFEHYDVVLCPVTFTTAFRHNQLLERPFRRILVNNRKRYYMDLFMWIAPATLLGLPATSAPVGLSKDRLPVNVQIIAGAYEDRTAIQFAELLAEVTGGFLPPPQDERALKN